MRKIYESTHIPSHIASTDLSYLKRSEGDYDMTGEMVPCTETNTEIRKQLIISPIAGNVIDIPTTFR